MKSLILLLTFLVFLGQSNVTLSDEYSQCLQTDCRAYLLAVVDASGPQKEEEFKYQKCYTGVKSALDTQDVSASVTHHADCTRIITFADLKTCMASCNDQELAVSNPFHGYVDCQNSCLDKEIAKEDTPNTNISSFSPLTASVGYQKCSVPNCFDKGQEADNTATDAQKVEYYKYWKCHQGEKHLSDSESVAASVSIHADCGATVTDFATLKTCISSCKTQELKDSANPYATTSDCQLNCIDEELERDPNSDPNAPNGSMLLYSSLVMVLCFAFLTFY